ncbi:MAG TPA: hypothetical protein VNJ71_02740 [Gemmatimonadales bacterium]|jgi:hypothetical protein|nr:hypothetical protein [Gemmatimonadales bacterium]
MRNALAAAGVVLLFGLPGGAAAQTDCTPDEDSNEARLFAHFSAPLAFSPAQSPWIYRAGSVQLGLEGTYLPDAGDDIATPTTCRPNKGPENVNLLFGFPRPRVGYSLPNGILLEASWIPPVRLNGVKPNLFAFGVSRTVLLTPGTLFMGRGHAVIGNIKAPFVCPEEALVNDPARECNGAAPSEDTYKPNIFGVELSLAWPRSGGRFRPYLGGGYNILHPRFQVHFRDRTGFLDNQKVEVNLSRWAVFGGVTLSPSRLWSFTGEAYATPADLITGRVRLNVELGR